MAGDLTNCGKDLASAIPNVGNEIRIFSWDGVPICKVLSENNISRIFVPKGDTIIFGIDEFNENQPLVKFNISNPGL